jgi:hypothetical protein
MPTTKHRVAVNLEDDEFAELAALAEKHNISMAWIGRKAILDLLQLHRENTLQLPLSFDERPERPKWPTQRRTTVSPRS